MNITDWKRPRGHRPLKYIETFQGVNRSDRRSQMFGPKSIFCVSHDIQVKQNTLMCQRCRRGRLGPAKPIARNEELVSKHHHRTIAGYHVYAQKDAA